MKRTVIGTCGYSRYNPGENWKEKYESKLQAFSDDFQAVELNRTFYKLPQVKTAEKWRRQVDEDFEFAVKAWQAMTHPNSSPTWNNRRDQLSGKALDSIGYLRPNKHVKKAWRETRERAEALDAEVVLVQTPGSFDCSEENIENMRQLFSEIDRGGLEIAWEPRGDWKENRDKVEELCGELDLIHVTDLMRERPVSSRDYAYVRLHGMNDDPYDYDYDYSDEELKELAEKLRSLEDSHEKVYCMFNNYEMYSNAERLRDLIREEK